MVATMLWSTSAATLLPVARPMCEARQHACHTPAIAQCCCPDVGARTLPVTAEEAARRGAVKPTVAVAALDLDTSGIIHILITPPPASFRETVHRAGPPRSLPLLHSSFLI